MILFGKRGIKIITHNLTITYKVKTMTTPKKPNPGRPRVKDRRVQFTISVSLETLEWFKSQPEPAGRIIERLLEQTGEMKK